MSIAENIKRVNGEITEAALRAGRDPSEVTVMAVTKMRTVDEIVEAAGAGIVHFGENRVQEAAGKIPEFPLDVIWHLIGHLQSNKSKRAVSLFHGIDTVHSKKIADLLSLHVLEAGRTLDVLIQVNISGEEVKSGIPSHEILELAQYVGNKEALNLKGLLTIGSFGVSENTTRAEFVRMRELFEELRADQSVGKNMQVLSMGMSGDYEIAVEEGATVVRIGTALFGSRN